MVTRILFNFFTLHNTDYVLSFNSWINLTTKKRRWWRRSVVTRISTGVDEKSIDPCGGGSTGASLFETWPIPLGQPVTPTGSACAPTFPIRDWVAECAEYRSRGFQSDPRYRRRGCCCTSLRTILSLRTISPLWCSPASTKSERDKERASEREELLFFVPFLSRQPQ